MVSSGRHHSRMDSDMVQVDVYKEMFNISANISDSVHSLILWAFSCCRVVVFMRMQD